MFFEVFIIDISIFRGVFFHKPNIPITRLLILRINRRPESIGHFSLKFIPSFLQKHAFTRKYQNGFFSHS